MKIGRCNESIVSREMCSFKCGYCKRRSKINYKNFYMKGENQQINKQDQVPIMNNFIPTNWTS